MQNNIENFPSMKAELTRLVCNILERVPLEQRSDVLVMVGKAYGLGLPKTRRVKPVFHSHRDLSKQQLIAELRVVKWKLRNQGQWLPASHPLVAQRDSLLERISSGRYSFRSPKGESGPFFFPQEEEEEEASEEDSYDFYHSDGDDSVNRVGP
jgi:hypothetical protein